MADIKQFGLDLGIYGPLAEPEIVINLAKYAETAGFSSIWLADHVVFPKRLRTGLVTTYPQMKPGTGTAN